MQTLTHWEFFVATSVLHSWRADVTIQRNLLKSEIANAESRYNQLAVTTALEESESKTVKFVLILGFSTISFIVLAFVTVALRRSISYQKKQKTKLDKALLHLNQRERFHRQLFEDSPSVILTHSLDGEVYSYNAMADMVLRHTNKINHLRDFVIPAYVNQLESFVNELKAHGESSGWFRTKDSKGVRRILRYRSKVVDSNNGPYVITFGLDDSEICKARLQMEVEKQRLFSVMENTPDVYCILKEDSTIEFINHFGFL